MEGYTLDRILEDFTDIIQEDIDEHLHSGQAPHTFSVEIFREHNTLRVVFNSTLSQPEDVTDRPGQCPGWGLHNASAEICNSCVYKVRCEEAQTVLVGKED
jgi:hypothetical protein